MWVFVVGLVCAIVALLWRCLILEERVHRIELLWESELRKFMKMHEDISAKAAMLQAELTETEATIARIRAAVCHAGVTND